MNRVSLSLCLSGILLVSGMANAAPLNLRITPRSTLIKEVAPAPAPTYELQKPTEEVTIIEKIHPPIIATKSPSDTTPPIISNLPNSVRYIGTGDFALSFEVNEPCFMENGYSGVLVWFNGTPMTRVSGALRKSGEQYVFRSTVPDNTPEGNATIKVRALDAAGNLTEVTNTMIVVYPQLSNKELRFLGKGPLDTSFGINKVLSKTKSAAVSAFLNDTPMSLLSTEPYKTGERYLFRAMITDTAQEGLATTRLRVQDAANNVSEIKSQKIMIDTTAPRISGLPTVTDYRQEGPFTLTFSVNEPISTGLGKSKIVVEFNGTPLSQGATRYDQGKEYYSYEGMIDDKTREGTANIVIQATDPAGNTTITKNDAIVVDLTTPQISNISVGKHFLSTETFTLQFDVNEYLLPGIGKSKVRVLFNDLPMAQASVKHLKGGVRYQYQTQISKNEKQGPATIQILLTDAVGHLVTEFLDKSEPVIVDTIAPSISVSPKKEYLPAGDFLITLHISEPISKQAGEKNIEAWFNKKRMTIVSTTPSEDGEITTLRATISPSEQQGPGELSIRVTDQSGNTATTTVGEFIVDTIPPIVYGVPNERRRVTSGFVEIGFGINEKLTPGVGQTAISAEFNGKQMQQLTTKSDEFGNWHSFRFPVTESTEQGEAKITLHVSDASGNKIKSSYPGIIVDSQPAILNELEIIEAPLAPAPTAKKVTQTKRRRR